MKMYRSAGAVSYVEHNGNREYLILHYADGHWDFPKGKIEENETIQEAAHRELREETGLSMELNDQFRKVFTYTFIEKGGTEAHKEVTLMLGRVNRKEVVLSHEHRGYVWLSYQDALQRLTFDNAKQALIAAEYYLHLK